MPKKPRSIKAWAVMDYEGEIQFPYHKDGFARIFKTRKDAENNVYQTEIGEKVVPCEIKLLNKNGKEKEN